MNMESSPIQQPHLISPPLFSTTSTSTFSTLPPELRHKIWRLTFEPRIVSLNWYEQRVPDTRYQRWVYTFTAHLGLHVDQISPEEALHNHSLNPQITYQGKDIFASHTRIKSPPGPIALEICRESREIALQHYERFLPGKLQFPVGPSQFSARTELDDIFDQTGWSEPHVWINPTLDLIFLSMMSRDITSPYAPVDAQFFWYRARYECSKFQNIGVMIHNGDPNLLLPFKKYAGLKKLTIFNTRRDAARDRVVLGEGERFLIEEEIAKGVVEWLAERREGWEETQSMYMLYEPWVLPIPKIRVSSDIEWWRNEEGRLGLRLAPKVGE